MKINIRLSFLLFLLAALFSGITGCSSSEEENSGAQNLPVKPPPPVLCERPVRPAQPYDPSAPAYEELSAGFADIAAEQFESSLEHYQKAVELDSNDPAGYYGVAFSYSNLEMNLDAIYYYSMVIQMDSTYRKAYYNRAFEAMGLQQYMDAKKDLDRAIELDDTDPDAFLNRGICKYSIGDESGACKDWKRVCPEMREGIVDVYFKESCN